MKTLMQQQIQSRQAEMFNPLLVKVEEAMASVSEELGLDFVLNRTSNTGDPIVFYASQRAEDITQKVIEKVNRTEERRVGKECIYYCISYYIILYMKH